MILEIGENSFPCGCSKIKKHKLQKINLDLLCLQRITIYQKRPKVSWKSKWKPIHRTTPLHPVYDAKLRKLTDKNDDTDKNNVPSSLLNDVAIVQLTEKLFRVRF